MGTQETRTARLAREEDVIFDTRQQLIWFIQASLGSPMFNYLACTDEDGQVVDPLKNGKYACVHYVSSVLKLVSDDLWVRSPGTWMKYLSTDLGESGWESIEITNAKPGDIITWDFFDGNQHVGFYWNMTMAVSMSRDNPADILSLRSPNLHPLRFASTDERPRCDGPRKILSVWTHPNLRR